MAKASIKQLRGAAHNLAHHSQSGLSWLHPHLARACEEAGVQRVSFDLLPKNPYPADLPSCEPLRRALVVLREWFLGQLDHLGHDKADLDHVLLTFEFRDVHSYDSAVAAAIQTRAGKEYSGSVDFICGAPSNKPLKLSVGRGRPPAA